MTKKKNNKKKLQSNENKVVKQRMKIDVTLKEKCFRYYAKGLTAKEVAKLFDLSFRTVQNWQLEHKWNDKLNPTNIKLRCYELKNKGMSYKEISNLLTLSVSTIQRHIKATEKHNENGINKL